MSGVSALFGISLHSLYSFFNVNEIETVVLSKGHSFLYHLFSDVPVKPFFSYDIYSSAQQILQISEQSSWKKRRSISPNIHKQVYIALLSDLSSSRRAEDSHIKCTMLGRDL